MNKVMLVGNLTAEPRVSTIESTGKTYCRFSIAINRFTRGDEKKADFIPIIAWEQLGQNCARFLGKGSKVAVVGSLQINSYTDAQGVKRQSAEVRAESVEFLNRVENAGGASTGYGASEPSARIDELEEVNSSDDDMPF